MFCFTWVGDESGTSGMGTCSMRFRIHGADRETGDETTFEVECRTASVARAKGNAAGYLVAKVEPIGEAASETLGVAGLEFDPSQGSSQSRRRHQRWRIESRSAARDAEAETFSDSP